jgi:hypothetical protein
MFRGSKAPACPGDSRWQPPSCDLGLSGTCARDQLKGATVILDCTALGIESVRFIASSMEHDDELQP